MLDRRKTERVFLRVPLLIRGVDENGAAFVEEAFTVEINRDGARLGLKNTPQLSSELQATNLANHSTALLLAAERCPQSYDGLPEWGVRFVASNPEFWGIVFAPKDEQTQPSIFALLTCLTCGRQELVSISFGEYQILCTRLFLPRLCPRCRIVGKWEVGSPGEGTLGQPQEVGTKGAPEEPPPGVSDASAATEQAGAVPQAAPSTEAGAAQAADAKTAPADRRRERRLTLKVPILVKSQKGETERTESSDVSKNGLSFAMALDVAQGEMIEVTVGYGVAAAPVARTAKVAWRRPEGTGARSLVGAWFTENSG